MDNVQLDAAQAFLGVGWAFPPHVTPDGRTASAAYEEDVRQAIVIIMSTNPGERVMRPDFGAGLNTFVFESLSATTLARVQVRVREALIAWEPRIDVLDVLVMPRGAPPNILSIEVAYRVRATNTLQNLVYPFYLQEGSAA